MKRRGVAFRVISSGFAIVLLIIPVGLFSCAEEATAPTPEPAPAPTPEPAPPPAPTMPEPAEVWAADGIIKVREYTGNQQFGDYRIFWRSDDRYAYIGISAPTTGFVSVGIQPGSRMKDADMVFGFVQDGEATVLDLFSTGDFGPHSPDTELGGTNDILEFGGSEDDGSTTIEFKRALNTGDTYDLALAKGTNKIIWAYGSADGLQGRHAARGYGEITL